MFEKLTKAFEPFGLCIIVISGLTLVGRLPIVDRAILGYVTIFVGVCGIVVHITNEMRQTPSKSKRKD
jgi:hypothetical protein